MVSSIGYALGAGSGIDTASLIEGLVEANRKPRENAIKKREDANSAQISALGKASSAITSFSSALSSLISGGSLFTQPTVSDSTILSAKALPGARLGGLSGGVEVKQIALGQTLVSADLASASATVGTGTITLKMGTQSYDITIDGTNNSLEGLAREINGKNSGVTANVVTSEGVARLVLKGPEGAARAFTLSVPDGTATGLERFAFGPAVTGGMVQKQGAQDAILVLDGIEVQRGSNTVNDLIPGVELSLKRAAAGTTVSLGSQRPTEAIKQSMKDFVDAYNELNSVLKELTAAGSPGSPAGPLYGDVGVRDMQRQLARLTTTVLSSDGGSVRTLAEVGIATNRDGTLALRADRLQEALTQNPDAVEALFNPGQHTSSTAIKITSPLGKVAPGTYKLTDIVPAPDGGNASGNIEVVINGKTEKFPLTGLGSYLIVPAAADQGVGLVIQVSGAVASATATVDPGIGGALKAINDKLTARNGPLVNSNDRLKQQADDIAGDRKLMETRSETYKARLITTYAAMEKRVSAFKATQSYIEQQVKAWQSND